jgi:hypothetical protein
MRHQLHQQPATWHEASPIVDRKIILHSHVRNTPTGIWFIQVRSVIIGRGPTEVDSKSLSQSLSIRLSRLSR